MARGPLRAIFDAKRKHRTFAMAEERRLQEEKFLYTRVHTICETYAGCAEKVTDALINGDHVAFTSLRRQYEKGRKEAVEISIKLSEQSYRHASLYFILRLCIKASDFRVAGLIARAITTRTIQDKILEEFPEYFVLNENNGVLEPSAIASAGGILK
jgi:hypothetical protein